HTICSFIDNGDLSLSLEEATRLSVDIHLDFSARSEELNPPDHPFIDFFEFGVEHRSTDARLCHIDRLINRDGTGADQSDDSLSVDHPVMLVLHQLPLLTSSTY